MRKILFSTLFLSSISFSFYKFKGPYIIPGRPVQPIPQQQPLPAGQLWLGFHQVQPLQAAPPLLGGQFQPLQQPPQVGQIQPALPLQWPQLIQQQQIGEQDLGVPIFMPQDIMNHKAGHYDIPFLWEPTTRASIFTTPLAYNNYKVGNQNISFIRPDDKDPIYDFLKCNFQYDPKQFWKLSNLVNYESITSGRKYGPLMLGKDVHPDLFYNIINDIKQTKFVIGRTFYSTETSQKEIFLNNNGEYILSDNALGKTKDTYMCMRLKRRFSVSDNKIDIVNEINGVKLYKKDKHGKILQEIDLKGALLNYYDPHYAQTLFALLLNKEINFKVSVSTYTAAWAATQLDHPTLKQKDYELLLNSTILAVWDVRAEQFNPKRYFYEEERENSYYFNRPVYTTLIGLARNDITGEVFHWITDLGRDIEVLFSLESSNQPLTYDQSTQTNSINLEFENKKRKRNEN